MKKLFLASVASKMLDKFIDLLDRPPNKLTVAFIATAADPYKDKGFVKEDRDKLVKLGFKIVDIDLKEKTERQLSEMLKGIDIIFIAGGNTFYLLQKVRESGFDKITKSLVKKGVIYIGSSAGSVLAGKTIEPVKSIDDPTKAPMLKSFEGLNLIDFIILPHFSNEKYKEKYKKGLKEFMGLKNKIIKLADNQAIVVQGNHFKIIEN